MSESSMPSEYLFNYANSSESQSLDWESQMAKLVGLEEDNRSTNNKKVEVEVESTGLPSSQPQEEQTEPSLSSNPFAKLGIVSAATLGVVLVAGVFLSQLMSAGNQKSQNNKNSIPAQPEPALATRPQQLESEVETLKTKLALTEQAEQIKAAQQKLRNPQVSKLRVTASRPISPASPNRVRVALPRVVASPRVSAPIRTAYIPRTVNVIRDIPQNRPIPSVKVLQPLPQKPVQPKPTPSPSPAPIKPVTQPIVQIAPQPTPTPTLDPLQEWSKLAKMGSYGLVSSVASNRGVNNPPPVAPQPTNTQPPQTPPPQPQPPVISQAQKQNSKSVAVGTSVKAVLATAVFGETTRSTNNSSRSNNNGNKDEENKTVFVVRLKQPLKSIDNAIALPEKTELLAEISSISEQGLLQLNVTKVILPNNNNPIERSLPQNALIIRAPQGRPLIANQYRNGGGSTLGADAGLFVLGGIGKAAELLNRNDSEIRFGGSEGYISSTSNRQRNVAAGIFEGGIRTIVPQITQRNQQAMSQLAQRTNIWFLAAGKEIEVYVNQTMQF